MSRRPLPPSASIVTPGDGARLVAPAASRNVASLCDLLADVVPTEGRALELASGTGQHVTAFAERFPTLDWQPTEIYPDRRASIDAYAAALPNTRPAAGLDATQPGWSRGFPDRDLVILINLLHLISWPEAQILIAETAKALAPGGRFVLYGPFMRAGQLTSDGDIRFHTELVRKDPEIGYKDDAQVRSCIEKNGLVVLRIVQMPANNLAFIARKPGT